MFKQFHEWRIRRRRIIQAGLRQWAIQQGTTTDKIVESSFRVDTILVRSSSERTALILAYINRYTELEKLHALFMQIESFGLKPIDRLLVTEALIPQFLRAASKEVRSTFTVVSNK